MPASERHDVSSKPHLSAIYAWRSWLDDLSCIFSLTRLDLVDQADARVCRVRIGLSFDDGRKLNEAELRLVRQRKYWLHLLRVPRVSEDGLGPALDLNALKDRVIEMFGEL